MSKIRLRKGQEIVEVCQDAFGQELRVGDFIAFKPSQCTTMRLGRISRMTLNRISRWGHERKDPDPCLTIREVTTKYQRTPDEKATYGYRYEPYEVVGRTRCYYPDRILKVSRDVVPEKLRTLLEVESA